MILLTVLKYTKVWTLLGHPNNSYKTLIKDCQACNSGKLIYLVLCASFKFSVLKAESFEGIWATRNVWQSSLRNWISGWFWEKSGYCYSWFKVLFQSTPLLSWLPSKKAIPRFESFVFSCMLGMFIAEYNCCEL